MRSIPHPIQYQGSKRNLASEILRYFPAGVDRLIEPFAGSAAICIAAATKRLAAGFVINDLNKPLVELLRIIVEKPEDTAAFYERIWNEQHEDSVEHYYRMRDDFNCNHDPRIFLYLLARCVKGAVRYNADGVFNQSPDKRRYGVKPDTMRKNIFGVSFLLNKKSTFYSKDYKEILTLAQKTDLVYMDPPYQGVCGDRDSRYFSGIIYDEFVYALRELNSREILYIVSYDGRRGDKIFGKKLPLSLNLTHIEIEAGRSTQATLLGREEVTFESLYLSPALTLKLSIRPGHVNNSRYEQLAFQKLASAL